MIIAYKAICWQHSKTSLITLGCDITKYRVIVARSAFTRLELDNVITDSHNLTCLKRKLKICLREISTKVLK